MIRRMTLARDAHVDGWTNRWFRRLAWRLPLALMAILTGACLAGERPGALRQANGTGTAFVVHVYNYAHFSDGLLGQAESEAERLFSRAGVDPVWVACPQSAECRATTGLTVNLVPQSGVKAPGEWHEFGYAVHTTAWICAGSLQPVVASRVASWPAVLGYVMAHELGHLLLGENSHSPDGVMRRHFGVPEWTRAARGQIFFSAAEGEKMRDRVAQTPIPGTYALDPRPTTTRRL